MHPREITFIIVKFVFESLKTSLESKNSKSWLCACLGGRLSGMIIYGESFLCWTKLLFFSSCKRWLKQEIKKLSSRSKLFSSLSTFFSWTCNLILIIIKRWYLFSFVHAIKSSAFLLRRNFYSILAVKIERAMRNCKSFLIRFYFFAEANSNLWHVIFITSLSLFEQWRCTRAKKLLLEALNEKTTNNSKQRRG